jgi:hypothetical protein
MMFSWQIRCSRWELPHVFSAPEALTLPKTVGSGLCCAQSALLKRFELLTKKGVLYTLSVYAFCRLACIGIRTADVAQSVEQLICNQQVGGSSPLIGSFAL